MRHMRVWEVFSLTSQTPQVCAFPGIPDTHLSYLEYWIRALFSREDKGSPTGDWEKQQTMRFGIRLVLLAVTFSALLACTTRTLTQGPVATASLYLATQGNSSIQGYSASTSNGVIDPEGSVLPTGSMPYAIAITPSLTTLFVDNNNSDDIYSYTINSDGTLKAGTKATDKSGSTASMPTGMAVDPGGKFLFVANEGSSTVAVYSINGTTLTEVTGSPFTTKTPGDPTETQPTAVAVSSSGNFLYVANNFTNTVGVFSIASSGALTQTGFSPYTVGLAPTGLGTVPSGAFLYVTNAGSNNVSAFTICDKVVTSCADPNHPDGRLTAVAGSPFSAGLGPIAIAADPSFNFLYVLNKQSSNLSEFSYAPGSGVLTALSSPTASTGLTPFSLVVIAGTTGSNLGNTLTNPTDFVFVSNNGASTVSEFSLNTTTGVLTPVGQATTVAGGNPSAVAAQ
ncbi:MAG: beta-propeller fold lactonase family protein [Acidobacteriaceae bacterium]|nr:beta-propeller fold lactonase family protein [Acidobacteriaceae bacterium]